MKLLSNLSYKYVYFTAKIYYQYLNFSANFLINWARYIGNQYTKIWTDLHSSSFDHRFDYLRGIDNYYWYERAILAIQRIKPKGTVLDVGCGDGIYSGLFYSKVAKKVDAIDLDKEVIEHAKAHYPQKNVTYEVSSIQDWFKKEKRYDIVLLFAVIEHFTPEDGVLVLKGIGKSLTKNGVFFGSTPIFSDHGLHNFDHKNEFFSAEKLKKFLELSFEEVTISTSQWLNGRNECYFDCRQPKK